VNEAMVAGLPVINSKYAGSADLIEDGANGWIIDPLNDADMLRGLQVAWETRHERAMMREPIRTAVAAMAVPAVAERIRRVVREVAPVSAGLMTEAIPNPG
jgi:glycosyltransferase involved in cell wall biosynthesis